MREKVMLKETANSKQKKSAKDAKIINQSNNFKLLS